MALLPIIQYPDPVLAAKAEPVTEFNDELRKLAADMAETMYAAPGVGLAANQVGSLKRIVVIDITDEKNNLLVLVNPYIKSHTEELAEFEEGCLSLKGLYEKVSYEQKDPLLIYKFESFGLFSKMIVKVNRDVLAILNKAYIPVRDQNAEAVQRERQERAKVDVNKLQASRMQAAAQAGQQDKQKPMPLHVEKKVGRNDPCPCGSGKKYKQCHGKGI